MPATSPPPRELVDQLDSRHEELLLKLDELNARIEVALAESLRSREATAGGKADVRNAA
jgi:hypothetical protein